VIDLRLKENKDGSLNFTKNITKNNTQKTINLLMYYLLQPIGTDPLYPSLGIDYTLLQSNSSLINIHIQQFLDLFNSTFGTNVKLVSVDTKEGKIIIKLKIDTQLLTVGVRI